MYIIYINFISILTKYFSANFSIMFQPHKPYYYYHPVKTSSLLSFFHVVYYYRLIIIATKMRYLPMWVFTPTPA